MDAPQLVEGEHLILKENANQAFKSRNYRKAIHLYTKALETVTPTTPVEFKRTVLTNRAQTYMFHGDIHSARHDINLALSSEYTTANSPTGITMKCLFRRAKLLCMFARYDEALSDYEQLSRMQNGPDIGTIQDKGLKQAIEEGLQAPEGSMRRQKDELMRAVDSRGIIIQGKYRPNFPFPPVEKLLALGPDFDAEQMCLSFNTDDGGPDLSLTDPNKTPLAIPLYIMAPYFQSGPEPYGTPFETREENPVAEDDTVDSLLNGLFWSLVTYHQKKSPYSFNENACHSAVQHESSQKSVVMVITYRNRFLIIPRTTTFKEIAAGARWPRDSPLPFEDMRRAPRASNHEEDGIHLSWGWFLDIRVIPNDKLKQFLDKLESDLPPPG